MASLTRRTGFLGALLAALALGACGTSSSTAFHDGQLTSRQALRTEFTQDSLLDIADRLRQTGDYNQALGFYQRAGEASPQDHRSFKGMGLTLEAMGAGDRAIEALEHAAGLDGEDLEVREALARLHLAGGRLATARRDFQWLVARDPGHSGYYNGLGIISDLTGDHAGAQAHYSMAIALAPDNLALRNNLALSFAFDGEYEAAVDVLSDMQDTPRARQNLALVYGLAGERGKAQEMALLDLSVADAGKNLGLYETLRGLPSHEQAAIVLLGRPVSERSAELAD